VTDAQVLTRISTRTPRLVNVTTDVAVSPQYELLGGRQRTIDGRWEPPRYRQRPEPVEPVVDEATAELFDGSVRPRPQVALETPCLNVPTAAPLGDASALPARSEVGAKYQLVRTVQGYAMGLPHGPLMVEAMAVLKVLRGCGTAVPPGEGRVRFRAKRKGKATASGLIRCKRWCCPTCGPFAARRRRESLAARAPVVARTGLHFHFVPTLRHHKGAKYRELRTVLSAIWRRMTQRGTWDQVLADIRADEVTYGRHGWHLHKHVLITLPFDADVESFKAWVQGLWEREATKYGRTCDWTHSDGWWSPVAPEAVETTAAYLQKMGEEPAPPVSADGLMAVAGGEVIAQASKPGSRPWDLEAPQYVELFVGSKRQRTFGLGGLWRTSETEAVEADEDAADMRELDHPEFASVAYEDVRDLRHSRFETMTWVVGSLQNESLRSEWVIRLQSVFGPGLEVIRDPNDLPPDDGASDGDPGVGRSPTEATEGSEAQGAAEDGTEADVAPLPAISEASEEAPESLFRNDGSGRSVASSPSNRAFAHLQVAHNHPVFLARRLH